MTSIDDFNFSLPANLIASEALSDRSSCRLLYLGTKSEKPTHDNFINIGNYLKPSDVLVVNNTKVMKARIFAYHNDTRIEVLLARQISDGNWTALIYSKGRLPLGSLLYVKWNEALHAITIIRESSSENPLYEISSNIDLWDYVENFGELPIPPYFKRSAEESDDTYYQTVYAKNLGAVAAPTAGLHFTDELLSDLRKKGISVVEITLHVGPGTFLPVRCKNIEDHKMHAEYFIMSEDSAMKLNQARERKQRIIAVGTTAMRVLEHVMHQATHDGNPQFFPCEGETSIFIKPGFKFLACDGLLTNFHIPRSTLVMLVSAVVGRERLLEAYEEAIKENYRFYSYGDACLFEVHP